MTIERTKDEIIIRLPASLGTKGLQELVDNFIYKEVASKSKAKQSDVDALAKEVKQGWWAKNRSRLIN